jgi:cell division protein FtsW (lipid II flippase)
MTAEGFVIDGQQEEPAPEVRVEWLLLGLGAAFLLVSFLALSMNRPQGQAQDWLHFVVWLMCAFVGSWLLRRRLPRHDPLLFPVTMFLSGWGLILIDRLAPIFADRQTVWLIVSVVAMLAVAIFPQPLRWLRTYRYVLLVIGLVLLISTIILGRNPSGQAGAPQLWLGIGSVFFQPSEVLKIILVAFLASYLAEQYPALRQKGLNVENRGLVMTPLIFGPIILMWGLSVIILIWQRDLGTAILFFVVFLTLLYAASGYTWILLSGAVLIGIAALVAYSRFDVVQLRVDIWLNPWPEAEGRAFQIVQSLLAFAAGGVLGQGVAQGSPTYIPVVHSDFVFAALGEEWGLLGVIAVICCIVVIVVRGMRIAVRYHARPFLSLLTLGLSMLIATQSLLIMGGVLKLLPLTGVTLPFLSYGGSSLLASFVIIGLLLRLSAVET